MSDVFLGVIGGSGLYEMEGFEGQEERQIDTPFGSPSDALIIGTLEGIRVAFLPRHGRGHRFSPSEIPYRANIHAMKQVGVDAIVSVSAVGSMREDMPPGTLVAVDQFMDRTVGRKRTFFENGVVGHVAFGEPICQTLHDRLYAAGKSEDLDIRKGGTYICIEGPQFSTRAESNIFRSWGVDVIGMTNLPEARLAREAEISYATLALVTDYDCWHDGHDDVTVETVIATLKANVANAKGTIRALARSLAEDGFPPNPSVVNALQYAVMTDPASIPEEARQRLGLLMKKYWTNL